MYIQYNVHKIRIQSPY